MRHRFIVWGSGKARDHLIRDGEGSHLGAPVLHLG
jgi:hypothetical protein